MVKRWHFIISIILSTISLASAFFYGYKLLGYPNLKEFINMLYPYGVPTLISILVALSISYCAFFKTKQNIETFLLAILGIIMIFLNLDILLISMVKDRNTALKISRLAHIVMVFAPPVYLQFIMSVLKKKIPKFFIASLYAYSIITALFTQTKYHIPYSHSYYFGYFPAIGPLLWIFFLVSLFITIFVLKNLHYELKNSIDKLQANRCKFVFIGYGITAVLFCLDVIPLYGIEMYPPSNFMFIPLSILSYGILRHDLLDIRVFFKKSIAYSIVTGIIGILFGTSLVFLVNFFSKIGKFESIIASTIFLLIVIEPIKNKIQSIIDKIFNYDIPDYSSSLKIITDKMSESLDIKQISLSAISGICSTLRTEFASIFILRAYKDIKIYKLPENLSDKNLNDDLINIIIGNKGIINYHEVVEKFSGKINIKDIHYSLFCSFDGKNISGFISIGNKLKNRMFSPQDYSFIQAVSSQLGIYLELAQIYNNLEEIADKRAKELIFLEREKDIAQKANMKLKEIDEMKSNFLSSVSHELRTPLTSILGFTKLIYKDFDKIFMPITSNDDKLQKKAKRIDDNLKIIINEGERLTRLINDVLDIAKIESGKIDWKDSEFLLDDLIKQAAHAVNSIFAEKPEISLLINLQTNGVYLKLDQDRLLQVLINLLNNSVKFTIRGSVSIESNIFDSNKVIIRIKDTGIGIPEKEIDKIFDRFHQVSQGDTLSDKPKGTGLGLSICKQIIEHYSGNIWSESYIGKGSIFSFILPVFKIENEKLDSITKIENEKSPVILVVDDDESIRNYIMQLLNNEGFNVLTASNGLEAINIAKDKNPDLITIDLLMPIMDGRKAIEQLKNDQNLRKIPIIVVSVLAENNNTMVDASISKPIDENRLIETVYSLLKKGKGKYPCMVITEGNKIIKPPILILCQGQMDYCKEDDLWNKIESGFEGTLLVPVNLSQRIDLEKLSNIKQIQIVIIPE